MKGKAFWFGIFSLLLPALLMAQPGSGKKIMFKKQQQILLDQLLTAEQKISWKKTTIEFQKKRNELQAQLKNAKLDLQLLMSAERVPDQTAVEKKLKEISELSFRLQRLNYSQKIAFRKMLSDDQWNRFLELEKELKWRGAKGRKK